MSNEHTLDYRQRIVVMGIEICAFYDYTPAQKGTLTDPSWEAEATVNQVLVGFDDQDIIGILPEQVIDLIADMCLEGHLEIYGRDEVLKELTQLGQEMGDYE